MRANSPSWYGTRHKAYTPKTRAQRISDMVYIFPRQFNIPQMSSIDATIHAAHDFIYSLQNTASASPLVKLGNGHKESFRTLSEIFRESNPLVVLPRVPVREVFQEKLQKMNQERTQIKFSSQSNLFTNSEHLRVSILNVYPEEIEPLHQAKKAIFFTTKQKFSSYTRNRKIAKNDDWKNKSKYT